jgi:Protein of unknown function (DUF2384)
MTDRVEQAKSMEASDPRRIAASIAMFDRLAEHWSLRGDEREMLLGGVPKSTWSEWKHRPRAARIRADTRERIANLFAIDLNAHSLFAPEFADRWVRSPNAAFGGDTPMSLMVRGKFEDVIGIRRYLESIRTSSPFEAARSQRAPSLAMQAVSYLPDQGAEHCSGHAQVWVSSDVYAQLEAIARQDDRPFSSIVADALAAYKARSSGDPESAHRTPGESRAKREPSGEERRNG